MVWYRGVKTVPEWLICAYIEMIKRIKVAIHGFLMSWISDYLERFGCVIATKQWLDHWRMEERIDLIEKLWP